MKGGPEGDASAFLIVAENANFPGLPKGMIVLDWFTSEAGEGDLDQDFKFVVGCLVPGFDGASLSNDSKDALWARFFMGAPRRQSGCVPRQAFRGRHGV